MSPETLQSHPVFPPFIVPKTPRAAAVYCCQSGVLAVWPCKTTFSDLQFAYLTVLKGRNEMPYVKHFVNIKHWMNVCVFPQSSSWINQKLVWLWINRQEVMFWVIWVQIPIPSLMIIWFCSDMRSTYLFCFLFAALCIICSMQDL